MLDNAPAKRVAAAGHEIQFSLLPLNPARPTLAPSSSPDRPRIFAGAALIVVAVLAAFHNSFSGAFVFDDLAGIVDNATIRQLWPLDRVFAPPSEAGTTVGGRPIVNLSLALNYAIGGTSVTGYHMVNLAIHLAAALALFGLVRRTLGLAIFQDRFSRSSIWLAAMTATLWAVHPLQTESVTYVIQRAESLVGLFYLFTLYAFMRFVVENAKGWGAVAVACCVLGMATKEVMATAPLLVLLYDRTFFAGSFRVALVQRWRWHLALAATWVMLGVLVLGAGNRGGTAGLGAGDSSWSYACLQVSAVVRYIALALWPQTLVFDYGTHLGEGAGVFAVQAIALLALLVATIYAIVRRPMLGFVGAWFFGILAPSSSVIPIAVQPMAEHRMYLPLAAVVVGGVFAVHQWLGRRGLAIGAVCVIGLGVLTMRRNEVYRTPLGFWSDIMTKRPNNPRGLCNYADFVAAEGRIDEAIAAYEKAVRLERPAADHGDRSLLPGILINLGNAQLNSGHDAEAAAQYVEALRYEPNSSLAHYNLASIQMDRDQLDEAAAHFEASLRIEPNYPSAHTNLSSVRSRQGRYDEALAEAQIALRLAPSAKTHANVGIALLNCRRYAESVAAFEAALKLQPEFFEAERFMADALVNLGRRAEALTHYQTAARLRPDDADVRRILSRW